MTQLTMKLQDAVARELKLYGIIDSENDEIEEGDDEDE